MPPCSNFFSNAVLFTVVVIILNVDKPYGVIMKPCAMTHPAFLLFLLVFCIFSATHTGMAGCTVNTGHTF